MSEDGHSQARRRAVRAKRGRPVQRPKMLRGVGRNAKTYYDPITGRKVKGVRRKPPS